MVHPGRQASEDTEKLDSLDDAEALQDASQRIQQAIREDNPSAAIREIENCSTDAVVELIVHMPLRQARILLDWMPRKRTSDVLLKMHPVNRSTIAKAKGSHLLAAAMGEMRPDEAAETAISFSRRTKRKLPRDYRGFGDTTDIKSYPEGTAGRIRRDLPAPRRLPAGKE